MKENEEGTGYSGGRLSTGVETGAGLATGFGAGAMVGFVLGFGLGRMNTAVAISSLGVLDDVQI